MLSTNTRVCASLVGGIVSVNVLLLPSPTNESLNAPGLPVPVPDGPVGPATPCGPCGPCEPVEPCGPCGPCAPATPCGP
jgi:hypothetical protein